MISALLGLMLVMSPPDSVEVRKYADAGTADSTVYMEQAEKDFVYYLNLARAYPKYYAKNYLNPSNGGDEASLYNELMKMEPLEFLEPEVKTYECAKDLFDP